MSLVVIIWILGLLVLGLLYYTGHQALVSSIVKYIIVNQLTIGSGNGVSKLDNVVIMLRSRVAKLPILLRVPLNYMLSDMVIKSLINKLVPKVKDSIAPAEEVKNRIIEATIKNVATSAVTELLTSSMSSNVNGDYNLVDNGQLSLLAEKVITDVNDRGVAQASLSYITDFEKKELVASVATAFKF